MEFDIVDCHGHIFPPLAEACGFRDAPTHLLHQQRAMHVHGNQPYRRARDHAVSTERPLWRVDDPSEAGRSLDARFRVGRNGRFEWTVAGEDHYVQFLPPYMHDLEAPPDTMVADMDYSGVRTVVLQNDHIYGNLAKYFAAAMRHWPGRFIGLAQVDEAFAYREEQLAWLEEQVVQLGMAGLYFPTTGYFRNGYRQLHDHPDFDPFWRLVLKHNLPVFWVQSAKSPIGDYGAEMRLLRRLIDRHPEMKHVLVHGIPTGLYADANERLTLPEDITVLLDRHAVQAEVLYPIGWGGKMNYPYARSQGHFRQLYDRFGPAKLMWGSDMPNVGRYCTYRQALTYLWDYSAFLTDADRRLVFRDNVLGLFAAGEKAALSAAAD